MKRKNMKEGKNRKSQYIVVMFIVDVIYEIKYM